MIIDKLGSIFENRRKTDRRIEERRKINTIVDVERRKTERRKTERRENKK